MQRWRQYEFALLGALAFLALAGTRIPGQNARPEKPSPAWASSGEEGPVPVNSPPKVIASTRNSPPTLPADARLPLPDDGLRPVPGTTPPPPDPPGPTVEVLAPTQDEIKQVHHVQQPPTRDSAPGSAVNVVVIGPASAAPGQVVSYHLVVRNTGSFLLSGVRVELPLPAGLRVLTATPEVERPGDRLLWRVGNLEVGGERRLRFEVQCNQPGDFTFRPSASFSSATGLRCSIVRPRFAMTVNGPEAATVGEKVVLQIEVGNYGTEVLRRLALRCDLSAGLTHPQGQVIEAELPGDLAPGQVRTVPLEVQAIQPGRHQAQMMATADGGRTAEATTVLTISESALALTQEGPRRAKVGQELAGRLEVSNPGKQETKPVQLVQVLPDGLEFVSASTGGVYDRGTRTITWTLPGLQASQRQSVTYQIRARLGGDWALHATARSGSMPEARSTHAVRIEAVPSLTMDLTAHDDVIQVGKETQYQMRLYNPGAIAARAVAMTVHLPEGLLPVHAEGPTHWQIRGQQVMFEPLAEMRPGIDAIYRLRVRGVRAGEGRFRVEARASGLTQALQREITSHVR